MVCFSTTLIVSPQINCQFLHINWLSKSIPNINSQITASTVGPLTSTVGPFIISLFLHQQSVPASTGLTVGLPILTVIFHIYNLSPHIISQTSTIPPNIVDFSILSPLIKVSPPTSMVIFPKSTVGLSTSTVGLPTSTVSFPRRRRIVAACTI